MMITLSHLASALHAVSIRRQNVQVAQNAAKNCKEQQICTLPSDTSEHQHNIWHNTRWHKRQKGLLEALPPQSQQEAWFTPAAIHSTRVCAKHKIAPALLLTQAILVFAPPPPLIDSIIAWGAGLHAYSKPGMVTQTSRQHELLLMHVCLKSTRRTTWWSNS
jgi:hypothetical protein